MDPAVLEEPLESRNGQSTCGDAEFAHLLAARLEGKNMESQADDEEEKQRLSTSARPPSPKVDTSKELPVEFETSHEVGLSSSFGEEEKEERKRAKVSQSYAAPDPEDLKFIIRDTVTGVAIDIRNQNAALLLSEVDQKLTKLPGSKDGRPWEDWWTKKREANYELLNASEKGDKDKIIGLLDESKHGDLIADVSFKGLDDYTPLHFAISEGYRDVAELLISRGASLEALTTTCHTPLHIACNRGNKELLEVLINAGANVNAQDSEGCTPAHILSSRGWSDALSVLLSKNPDLSKKNNFGETATEVASSIEIRHIFSASAKEPETDDGYKRTVMEGVILHNNRADMIKSLMFKTNLLASAAQSHKAPMVPIKSGPPVEEKKVPPPIPKPAAEKTRRIKILEATKKLKHLSPGEEKKESGSGTGLSKTPSPGNGKLKGKPLTEEEDVSVGPEDFDPIQILGKGSFGEVYLVKYRPTGKRYAMKILNKRRVLSQNLVKYAKTERNVLCFTKHPFIVGLDFAFQTAEKLFMIMEFCPGGDLGHVIQREKRLPEDRARIYAAEILLALGDLHKRDIIFRDLKPDNVVLDEDGHALLTDFGLSKEGVSDNSSAQSFCGSVAYLAPEMLRKSGHGKSVDWYLLGVLLYELVVGQPPYFNANREQLFKNIQTAPLKLPMYLSADIKNLLIALLNRNPAKRLGSGKADAEEIKRHSWFKTIDWDDAINRKLKPPKPFIKEFKSSKISADIFIDNSKDENHIKGWDHVVSPMI